MTSENRKVRGATECVINGTRVRSKSERDMYVLLRDCGLNFLYEPETLEVRPGFTATHFVGGQMRAVHVKPITYTPDFVVYGNGLRFLIDVKGYKTDWYMLKKKLVLEHIEAHNAATRGDEMVFVEVSGRAQMEGCAEMLRRYCADSAEDARKGNIRRVCEIWMAKG